MKNRDVYIGFGLRTPIGIKGKQFKHYRPELLGAHLLNQIKKIESESNIDSIICGNTVGTGGNIGRLMTLFSDYESYIPVQTIDMQCASSSSALFFGYLKISTGINEKVLVGGIESSSLQPMRRYAKEDNRNGEYTVAQFSPDSYAETVMLEGVQRVCQKYGFRREMLDKLAFLSHKRALTAKQGGYLEEVILPMEGMRDQGVRKLKEAFFQKLPRLMENSPLLTIGNVCLMHDAAAFLTLQSQKTEFRIVHIVEVAGDPKLSPELVHTATEKLLTETHTKISDYDAIEWNEPFAAIDALFNHYYPEEREKFNIFGGALAYGHPYACSGIINILHLMQALKYKNKPMGLTAIAGAGGVGMAISIEYLGVKNA